VEPIDADGRSKIDEALQEWRQGDCVLGEQWFAFRIAPDAPLTDDAVAAAAEGADNAESEVFGFAVVTQTCDIVRGCDGPSRSRWWPDGNELRDASTTTTAAGYPSRSPASEHASRFPTTSSPSPRL
jgi:hypothetical protein